MSEGTRAATTLLTAAAVATFVATHDSSGVWLIGSSHRWAAGTIAVLALVAHLLDDIDDREVDLAAARTIADLEDLSVLFAVLAVGTGAHAPLTLLLVSVVALWAVTTLAQAAEAERAARVPSPRWLNARNGREARSPKAVMGAASR